jgi:hypothetical protein
MATKQPLGPRLAYKPREAAELTPYGYERLLEFIRSGELPARQRKNADGEPVGPFIILHEDLVKFLQSIPAA